MFVSALTHRDSDDAGDPACVYVCGPLLHRAGVWASESLPADRVLCVRVSFAFTAPRSSVACVNANMATPNTYGERGEYLYCATLVRMARSSCERLRLFWKGPARRVRGRQSGLLEVAGGDWRSVLGALYR